MMDPTTWFSERIERAPAPLRARMTEALASVPAVGPFHEQLAQAAETCLVRAMRDSSRESALELLSADALFTHACEAAAEAGSGVLEAFASAWDANRFENLVPKPA